MRLINCSTLQLEEFFGTNIPRYAILSHTWGDEEVSFADFTSGRPIVRSGYRKIRFTCWQAIEDGIGYAWVDTCCIDKSSSAELSEAINSMFAWYQESVCCYVYLSDVLVANMDQDLPKSRWFTRGWTLQELLAPGVITFYDQEWVDLGCREEHAEQISRITGIDESALWRKDLWQVSSLVKKNKFGSYCVATRMSWASTRQTTRAEDMAYCLLGIFNINMPLLYGEGDRAFRRLQEEIIRKIDDDSILAWGLSPEDSCLSPLRLHEHERYNLGGETEPVAVLARSPKDFTNCADLSRATEPSTLFTLINTGLQVQLPIVEVYECTEICNERYCQSDEDLDCRRVWIGLLGCSRVSNRNFLGILLHPVGDEDKFSARVWRERNSHSTVTVGPRVAFDSVSKTLTIAGYNEFEHARDRKWFRDEQIIINECKAIRRFGYRLHGFIAWKLGEEGKPLVAYRPLWDPETKILTRREKDPGHTMFEFSFKRSSELQDPKFTVFISRKGRGTVRKGDVFSEDERKELIEDSDPHHDKGDVLVHNGKGRPFHISIEVHTKIVGHHELVRVDVDALEDRYSDKEHSRNRNCTRHVY